MKMPDHAAEGERQHLLGDNHEPDKSRVEHNSVHTTEPQCTAMNSGKTTAAYLAFFGGGIGNAIIGATLLHLRLLTHTSVENVASLFTWRAIGCLCGNLFVAATFDRSRPEAILAFASFMVGAMNLCVPWCENFIWLAVVIALQGLVHGMLGGGCNGYVVSVWRLRSPPFLHVLQFIISFGSAITPFLVDVFVTTDFTHDTTTEMVPPTSLDNTSDIGGVVVEEEPDVFLEIVYPYIIAGIVMMIASAAFAVMLALELISSHKAASKGIHQEVRKSQAEKDDEVYKNKSHMVFKSLVIAFCMVYGGMECTYGGFILTFAVEYLGTSFETATLITTAFWGALAGGRVLAIILVRFLKPHHVISGCLVLATTAIVTLTFACNTHIMVSIICSALIGTSFAPIFANMVSYSQTVVPVTGRDTSWFAFGLYMGFVFMPAAVGFLFTRYSPMLLLYIMAGAAFTTCGLFVCVIAFAKNFVVYQAERNKIAYQSIE